MNITDWRSKKVRRGVISSAGYGRVSFYPHEDEKVPCTYCEVLTKFGDMRKHIKEEHEDDWIEEMWDNGELEELFENFIQEEYTLSPWQVVEPDSKELGK